MNTFASKFKIEFLTSHKYYNLSDWENYFLQEVYWDKIRGNKALTRNQVNKIDEIWDKRKVRDQAPHYSMVDDYIHEQDMSYCDQF